MEFPVQQMMKPVTKTNKDEVRILTNYAPVRLKLNNMKFTPTEIKEIINYIQIKMQVQQHPHIVPK